MRKVLLVHISPSSCCNTLVTMLNNGDFGFPYCAILPRFPPLQSGAAFSSPAFSTPAVWCRVFQSRVFHPCSLVPRFLVPRFPPLQSGAAFSSPAFSSQDIVLYPRRIHFSCLSSCWRRPSTAVYSSLQSSGFQK